MRTVHSNSLVHFKIIKISIQIVSVLLWLQTKKYNNKTLRMSSIVQHICQPTLQELCN